MLKIECLVHQTRPREWDMPYETEEERRLREEEGGSSPDRMSGVASRNDFPKYAEPTVQQTPAPLMDAAEPLPTYQPPQTQTRAPMSVEPPLPTYTAPGPAPVSMNEASPLMVVKHKNGAPEVIGQGSSPLERKATELASQIDYKPENHNSRINSGLITGGRGLAQGGLVGGLVGLITGLVKPKSDEEYARRQKIRELQPEVATLQREAKAESDLADDALDRQYKRAQIVKTLKTPTHAPDVLRNADGGVDLLNKDDNSVTPVKNKDGTPYRAKPEEIFSHSADGSMIWSESPGKVPRLIHDARKKYNIGGVDVNLTDAQYANYVAQRSDVESRQQKDQVDQAAINDSVKTNIESMESEKQKIWTSIKDMPRSIQTMNGMGDMITIMNPEYKIGIDRYQQLDDDIRKGREKIKPVPTPVINPRGAPGPKYKVDPKFLQ